MFYRVVQYIPWSSLVPVTRVSAVVVCVAIIILSRRALCGPSQLIRASRDIRVREAPELQSGDTQGDRGTSDHWQ